MEDIYSKLRNLLTILTTSQTNHLLIIQGTTSNGKSYQVKKILRELQCKYTLTNGYSTPLDFYQNLYYNRDKILLLDDAEGILNDKKVLSILKCAIETTNELRETSYNTSKDIGVPHKFYFKGKIIIIVNSIPDTIHTRAVQKRAITYNFKPDYEDMKKQLYEIAEHPELSKKECTDVIDLLIRLGDANNQEVTMRDVILSLEARVIEPTNWMELISDTIFKNPLSQVLKEIQGLKMSNNKKAEYFCDLTGMSRSTYYRLNKKND